MLYFGTKFINTGLFSIRSAGRIGTVDDLVINPHNLHIDGFYCSAMNGQADGVVVDLDVREINAKGIIINDHEDISAADELVRLTPIIELQFQLIGKPVYAGKSKVGKVTDFAVDTKSLFIQKLYVQPTLLKSMSVSQLIFDRQSIIEVTDHKVVVSGPEQTVNSSVRQSIRSGASFSSSSASTISE